MFKDFKKNFKKKLNFFKILIIAKLLALLDFEAVGRCRVFGCLLMCVYLGIGVHWPGKHFDFFIQGQIFYFSKFLNQDLHDRK